MNKETALRMIRYVISGGTSALVLFLMLTFLHETLKLPVVMSSIIAYVFSTSMAFTLQKFWTWKNAGVSHPVIQFGAYVVIAIFGILFDAIVMHYLVDILKLQYILAQIITIAFIVSGNYILYDKFVFKRIRVKNHT